MKFRGVMSLRFSPVPPFLATFLCENHATLIFIEFLLRDGREEDVPKENFCGWLICGQHCAKPTHQYNREVVDSFW